MCHGGNQQINVVEKSEITLFVCLQILKNLSGSNIGPTELVILSHVNTYDVWIFECVENQEL